MATPASIDSATVYLVFIDTSLLLPNNREGIDALPRRSRRQPPNGRTGYHAAGSAPKRGLPHFRKRPVIAAMTQSWVVPLDLAPPLRAGAFYCRRQLFANAAIAASRVAS